MVKKQKLLNAVKATLAALVFLGLLICSSMLEADSLEQSRIDAQTASYIN